jgi:hypothetical protein
VRRRHHDAVGAPLAAAAVVRQDRARDRRRGGHAAALLDHGLDAVGRQHLERRALCRSGERVRVLAQEERSIGALAAPVVADRLGDGEHVGLGERARERRAAMPAGAERDALRGVVEVGLPRVVLALEAREIDEQLLRRGPAMALALDRAWRRAPDP